MCLHKKIRCIKIFENFKSHSSNSFCVYSGGASNCLVFVPFFVYFIGFVIYFVPHQTEVILVTEMI